MNQRKLKSLTVREKLKIIQAVSEGNQKKKDIAANFGIPCSTLSTILKNAVDLQRQANEGRLLCKRKRDVEFPDVEDCMVKWFKQCQDKNISLGGPLLREKAENFAKTLGHKCFKASNGWLENFKKRHNIVFKNICGESASLSDSVRDGLKELNSRGIHSLQPTLYTGPKPKLEEEASSSVVSTSVLPKFIPSEVDKKKPSQACASLCEGDECKALSMLWISKLKKLDRVQRVIAEDLITHVLTQAFFEELTRTTQIFDGGN